MNKCTWCGLTPDPYTYLGNQWPGVHQVDGGRRYPAQALPEVHRHLYRVASRIRAGDSSNGGMMYTPIFSYVGRCRRRGCGMALFTAPGYRHKLFAIAAGRRVTKCGWLFGHRLG